jgi:hypothetical protein
MKNVMYFEKSMLKLPLQFLSVLDKLFSGWLLQRGEVECPFVGIDGSFGIQ